MSRARGVWTLVLAIAGLGFACAPAVRRPPVAIATATATDTLTGAQVAFLDTLQRVTFDWFWDLADPVTGLTPDRHPTPAFASVGASGFALTAYGIGAERGWVTRAEAAERVRVALEFFWSAPQGPERTGVTGHRGFFYHFLEPRTGLRFEQVELSTVDTALLLGGVLFCQSYFDRDDRVEARIRAMADSIVRRVDWDWATVHPPTVTLGWHPETGPIPYDWRGYNEAMLLYVFALGSPTHPASPKAWDAWVAPYRWGTFHGSAPHVGFAPLFGHQYSHVWIDFRGIQDAYMRRRGIDYFENSVRATLAQRAYAIANPSRFKDYGADLWGITACDGPLDTTLVIAGRTRAFMTYAGRGADHERVTDDGTLAPTAAGGSLPFAPRACAEALMAMRARYGEHLWNRYGFLDSFNPTLDVPVPVRHGRVVPGVGWFDGDQLGIDQGPIVCMIENHRSGLVWRTLRRNPVVVRGLRRAGFTGGWLDSTTVAR